VVVVGADIWNGTTAELQDFRNRTGATYPLLLSAATATGNNVLTLYGDRDNYVIIDQRDTVRFSARSQGYNYGAAFDLPRMTALIDSLLAHVTGVGDPSPAGPGLALSAAPNPGRGAITLSLEGIGVDGMHARIEVFDLSGRRIAAPFDGVIAGGAVRARWDGRDSDHATAPPGLYWVRARIGERVIARRIALIR
jgi:hypothetical protein